MNFNYKGRLVPYLNEKLSPRALFFLRFMRDHYRKIFDAYPYRASVVRHKSIFIHIPKSAGTSILKAMGGWSGDHCSYREFQRASPTRFERYYKFCFVRNPYDRLVSVYEYLKQGGNKGSDLVMQSEILSEYNTFDKFVNNYLDKDIIYRVNLLRPQYWFIYDEKNQLKVDFVAKFENIDNDYRMISAKIKARIKELPLVNVSVNKSKDYMKYYDENLKKKVQELYILDFKLLDYDK